MEIYLTYIMLILVRLIGRWADSIVSTPISMPVALYFVRLYPLSSTSAVIDFNFHHRDRQNAYQSSTGVGIIDLYTHPKLLSFW